MILEVQRRGRKISIYSFATKAEHETSIAVYSRRIMYQKFTVRPLLRERRPLVHYRAADLSPTERALNSPSRTTLRLLQRATVLGGRCTGIAASLVLDTWLQVARRPYVADDDRNPTDDVIDFRSVGEARKSMRHAMNLGRSQLCLPARLPRRRDRPNREITCFVSASNSGAFVP